MGAVVGYGHPLQGCCLEGFDFLGLHQVILGSSIGLGRWPFKSQRRVRFPYSVPSLCGISLVVKRHPSKLKLRVRFSHPAPVMSSWKRKYAKATHPEQVLVSTIPVVVLTVQPKRC